MCAWKWCSDCGRSSSSDGTCHGSHVTLRHASRIALEMPTKNQPPPSGTRSSTQIQRLRSRRKPANHHLPPPKHALKHSTLTLTPLRKIDQRCGLILTTQARIPTEQPCGGGKPTECGSSSGDRSPAGTDCRLWRGSFRTILGV